MKSFLLMLSFFTRLPVPQMEFTEDRYKKGINTLPLVGLVMGGILYVVSFLDRIVPASIMGVLLYFAYIMITGGLHLDGLADSCDALFSGRDKDKMLEIMKDSRNGTFGVLGLIIISAAYIVLLPQMPREALLIFPVIGKCAPAISTSLAPYIREEGMGKIFAENCKISTVIFALVFANVLGFILNPFFALAADIAFISIFVLTKKIKSLLDGITGDIFGLLCEVSQIIFLLAVQVMLLNLHS